MIRVYPQYILAAFFVLNSYCLSPANTLVRNPAADAQANFAPSGPTLDMFVHGQENILVESDLFNDESSFGLLEFDIAALDASQTILSASLQIRVNLWTGQDPPEARAGVYDGEDGAITDLDYQPAINAPLSGLQTADLGLVSIDLDPAHVQAVVDANSDYLGVSLLITEDGHNYGFAASESSFFEPPELTIEFVPEPATFVLLGVGLAALYVLCRGRRDDRAGRGGLAQTCPPKAVVQDGIPPNGAVCRAAAGRLRSSIAAPAVSKPYLTQGGAH